MNPEKEQQKAELIQKLNKLKLEHALLMGLIKGDGNSSEILSRFPEISLRDKVEIMANVIKAYASEQSPDQ